MLNGKVGTERVKEKKTILACSKPSASLFSIITARKAALQRTASLFFSGLLCQRSLVGLLVSLKQRLLATDEEQAQIY